MDELKTLSHDEARAFYDGFGAKQDSQAFYEEPALRDLIAHAAFEEARSVFELGCGTGRVAEMLLQSHLPPQAHYLGVDVSSTMVGLAQRRLQRFGERAEVRQAAGTLPLPTADGSCDRFLSTYVLDLLSKEDIAATLSDARRILDPAGGCA